MKDKATPNIGTILRYIMKTHYAERGVGILYGGKLYKTPYELYLELKEQYGEAK
jgi:hypothetical protein